MVSPASKLARSAVFKLSPSRPFNQMLTGPFALATRLDNFSARASSALFRTNILVAVIGVAALMDQNHAEVWRLFGCYVRQGFHNLIR